MRPFEICLLLANVAALFAARFANANARFFAAGVVLLAFVAHGALEGLRWQMAFCYFAAAAVLAYNFHSSKLPPFFEHAFFIALLLALGVSAALGFLFPVFDFPKTTGAFRVGTITSKFAPPQQTDVAANGKRTLKIQFWYPVEAATSAHFSRALYTKNFAEIAPHTAFDSQRFFFDNFRLVRARAFLDAPISQNGSAYFPVLIFSPAWDGLQNQNTFQVEELASHGFIVAGIDHLAAGAMPDLQIDFSTAAGFEHFLKNARSQVKQRAADVRFVLDEIEKMNRAENSFLRGRADVSRVGVFGHSFGGAVAAQVCADDARFKAGIDMDGVLFGDATRARLEKNGKNAQSFLFMNDDTKPPTPEQAASNNYSKWLADGFRDMDAFLRRNGGTKITISGAAHENFSDAPLFTRLRRLTDAGKIDPRRAMKIINSYSVAFFEKHLAGKPAPLLEENESVFPEATLEKFQPGE